jgi:uncharacterized protein YdeI (YjbR/CyaY-like superfamily)
MMMKNQNRMNPQVDLYIEKSADFAQPIMTHLRKLVHETCPMVEEKMKWSFPCFDYKGSILCSMASFKQHCSFGFWLASIMDDPEGILNMADQSGMGQLGKIRSMDDLPSDEILKKYILEAIRLIDQGKKLTKTNIAKQNSDVEIPDSLSKALDNNPKARASFEQFSPSKKKEYIVWISEAKTEATRERRLETAIEWILEGKSKNWKYEKK